MSNVIALETSRRAAHTTAPDALDALAALVAEDMAAVNQLIVQRMESHVPLIPQLAGHLIAAGGKRLRPILTLAAAKLCKYPPRSSRVGKPCPDAPSEQASTQNSLSTLELREKYQVQRHHKLAACVEFIHTATLLHDDVVDASDLRRGGPSANALFGNQASVLVGDFLFSRAFQLMVEDGSIDVLRILSNASAIIAEGEVLQLATVNNSKTSEQAYLEVVRAKTAELFAAACRIGAVVAGRPSPEEEALRTFGLNLGIAFQIVDDVLDYSADPSRLGKTVGDDFREGKVTLPVILAIHRGSEAERRFWHRALDEHDQRDGDMDHARDIMRRHNVLSDAIDRAGHYGAIARDALGLFPDHPARQALLDIIDFTVEREF